MRVGFVLKDQFPEHGGGYTFQNELLAALLALAPRSGHEFSVVCSAPMADALAPLLQGARVIRFEHFRAPPAAAAVGERPRGIAVRAAGRVKRLLRAVPQVSAFPPTPVPPQRSPMAAAVAAAGLEFAWFPSQGHEILDVPYATTVWDLEHRNFPWFPELSAGGEWQRREDLYAPLLRRAAVVIAGTQVGKAEITNFYQVAAERVEVLPHPTPRFALDAPPGGDEEVLQRHGLRPGYLFYPAQFWAHKNHETLLRALKQLETAHADQPVLVLTGSDKGTRPQCEALCRELGLESQVRILGFVPQAELPALYRQAAALVYPSFLGPENLPPLEAFALGFPVVAADIAGAREQLGDCALLVPAADAAAFAGAIRGLLASGERRAELVRKARARALAWTPESFVQGMFAILDRFAPLRRGWRAE